MTDKKIKAINVDALKERIKYLEAYNKTLKQELAYEILGINKKLNFNIRNFGND